MNDLKKQWTLGSLFDGIGGWCLAAEHNGIRPVWSSEIEKFPLALTKVRFPNVKQLGDITKIKVEEIEPVDIICAGSPCQDLSVAGKREGLAGERSGLFRTAISIVRRMRMYTGGRQPRFFIWENVPGAFSSNKGLDFKAVLEEIGQTEVPMPDNNRWANAGMVQCDECDIAWRVLDAQFFGVPQRRKRIFLIADFGKPGVRCAEVLFERESLPRNTEPGLQARQKTAGSAEESAGNAVCLRMRGGCDGGGKGALLSENKSLTLAANTNDQVLFEHHPNDCRVSGPVDPAPTVSARYGTGGNNTPLVLNDQGGSYMQISHGITGTLRAEMGGHQPLIMTENIPKAYSLQTGTELEVAKSLDTSCRGCYGKQNANVVAYCIAGNTIDRQIQNGGNGKGVQEEKSYTLNTIDRHAVVSTTGGQSAYAIGNGQTAQLKMQDMVGTLNCMHDQIAVMQQVAENKLSAACAPTTEEDSTDKM